VVARRPARWLILTQYYAPEIGAPQIRLRAFVRELRRHGVEASVLTALPNYPTGVVHAGYRGRWFVRERIDGVPVRRTWVYAATGKSARVRLANYLSFTATALVSTLFGPRPDLLFVESQPLSLGLIAILMKWLRGVPYVYNVPDLQVDMARQLGFIGSARLLAIAAWAENVFLRRAWKVSTVTSRFIEHFRGRGVPADRVTFLPNGADADFLRPVPYNHALAQRWGVRGKKVFLYVGTHAYYHGLDVLIAAAEQLQRRSDLVFLLVGDGPERARLRTEAAARGLTNVTFAESPYEEMDQLYSIAYASIATLRKLPVAEGMRLSKVFPSLSCRVPVIYAGEGEAARLLEERACGMAIPPERPDLLAAAIESLADQPAVRAEMGHAGRRFIETDMSWAVIVERWLREIAWDGGPQPAPARRADASPAANLLDPAAK
jgi:colanic acid biosynthesis glycosyl transferase WcaI